MKYQYGNIMYGITTYIIVCNQILCIMQSYALCFHLAFFQLKLCYSCFCHSRDTQAIFFFLIQNMKDISFSKDEITCIFFLLGC